MSTKFFDNQLTDFKARRERVNDKLIIFNIMQLASNMFIYFDFV